MDTAAALGRDREPGEGDSEGRLQQEKNKGWQIECEYLSVFSLTFSLAMMASQVEAEVTQAPGS